MRVRKRQPAAPAGVPLLVPPLPGVGEEPDSAEERLASSRWTLILLLGITLFGLTLRLIGVTWGLPNPEHFLSYHPDEVLLVGAAQRVNPLWGQFDTGFYNYGSLTIFLTRLGYDFSAALFSPAEPGWAMDARFHLIGRLLSVLLGAATIPLVFDIGRRLAGRVGGLSAALVLAILPAHVAHSHYFTVDVPATFFVAAALCAAMRLLERPWVGMAVLAGACAGLAAATKYNAGLVLLAPLAALLLAVRPVPPTAAQEDAPEDAVPAARPSRPAGVGGWLRACFGFRCLSLAVLCAGVAAVAFLVGCPGVILNQSRFLEDFFYEVHHVRTGHGLLFISTPPGWIYHLTASLRFGLGIPLLGVVLAAGLRVLRRPRAGDWVLAAWVIPYYLLIGAAQVKFLRYTIPLAPALAVWVGVLCAQGLAGITRSRGRALTAALLVGVGFWTLGDAIAYDVLLAATDPRDAAAEAIGDRLSCGATVALLGEPWFYSPPLVPWNGGTKTRAAFEGALHQGQTYALLPGGTSLFLKGDLLDAPGLAKKLDGSPDTVSSRLRPQLSANLRAVLNAYNDTPHRSPVMEDAFLGGLNDLLLSGSLSDLLGPSGLAALSLSPETRALIAQNPRGSALLRLNRLLLEDAYPKEIHCRPERWTAARLRAEHPDCFVFSSLEVRDELRLLHARGISAELRAQCRQTRDLIAALDADYRKQAFTPAAAWPGLLGPGCAPEDWVYPAPTLYVYTRR